MIENYSVQQWILFLYCYSFLGWVFESVYVSIKSRKWVNRGFLKGPFLPIYGTGAVMMLFVSDPFESNLVLTYISGVIGATALELAVGVGVEAIFKVRYWDYSYQKYNYKGYICLSSSIAWGFFTIIMDKWIHPVLLDVLSAIPHIPLNVIFHLVTAYLFADTVISVKEALDLREAMLRLEKIRQEAGVIRRRADVVMACLNDDFEGFVREHPKAERLEEICHSMERQLELTLEKVKEADESLKVKHASELTELKEMREKLAAMRKRGLFPEHKEILRFKKRIMNNPTMRSAHLTETFESLREMMEEKEN